MTAKERYDLIKQLENEIKMQIPIITDSIKCSTMSDTELKYFKDGVDKGLKLAIDILREERY
jgi:hypothetical protein